MARKPVLNIENAHIIFRNFAGKETQFNRAGERNFCVIIDSPEQADILAKDGWNIKQLRPLEEGDRPANYIPVSVSYKVAPPKVIMINPRGRQTVLDEDSIEILDYADIVGVDLSINPYEWEVNGKTGIKAYLKAMYVTIEEDAFEAKYAQD